VRVFRLQKVRSRFERGVVAKIADAEAAEKGDPDGTGVGLLAMLA
jgi:hypothetical protein